MLGGIENSSHMRRLCFSACTKKPFHHNNNNNSCLASLLGTIQKNVIFLFLGAACERAVHVMRIVFYWKLASCLTSLVVVFRCSLGGGGSYI